MTDVGVLSLAQLRERGVDARELSRLVSMGRLERLARGWYRQPSAHPGVVRAFQLGGRLGCLSACKLHGVWVPPFRDLHVSLNPGAPLRTAEGVDFHRLAVPCKEPVLGIEMALAQVIQRHDWETGLVVLESAVDRGLLPAADARAVIRQAPERRQRGLAHFRLGAQSGSETRLRAFFQQLRVPVESQVEIPGVGRVDMLVGRSLIVEADSEAHHGSAVGINVDRERDLNARALGYEVLRLSFPQIWVTWPRTQEFLRALLRSRRHLIAPYLAG